MRRYKRALIFVTLGFLSCRLFGQDPRLYPQLLPLKDNGLYGFINTSDVFVIPPQFEEARFFHEGLARVKTSGKWGFVDETGAFVVEPVYEESDDFSEGLAYVKQGGKWGYVNKAGELSINPSNILFDAVGSFTEGLAWVRVSDKWGYIDTTGKVVIKPFFERTHHFINQLAPVKFNGLWGYADKNGKVAIPPSFDRAHYFFEGVASVQSNGLWGFIDKEGRYAIPPQFAFAGDFHDGRAMIMEKDKYGFIDHSGTTIIPCQYIEVSDFSEGLARIVEVDPAGGNIAVGFIDVQGETIFAPQFHAAGGFFLNGWSSAELDGKDGYISKEGRYIGNIRKYEGWMDISEVHIRKIIPQKDSPWYEAILRRDSISEYWEQDQPNEAGHQYATLNKADFGRLARLVHAIDFWDAQKEYDYQPLEINMGVETEIEVVSARRSKTVSNQVQAAPSTIWALEMTIDVLVQRMEWQKYE